MAENETCIVTRYDTMSGTLGIYLVKRKRRVVTKRSKGWQYQRSTLHPTSRTDHRTVSDLDCNKRGGSRTLQTCQRRQLVKRCGYRRCGTRARNLYCCQQLMLLRVQVLIGMDVQDISQRSSGSRWHSLRSLRSRSRPRWQRRPSV